MQVKGYFLV